MSSPPFPRRRCFLIAGVLFLAIDLDAQDLVPFLGSNEIVHLQAALHDLNMTELDMGFDKDVAEPQFMLSRVRQLLKEPLKLPRLADEVMSVARAQDPLVLWTLSFELLEVTPDKTFAEFIEVRTNHFSCDGDPILNEALNLFFQEAQKANTLIQQAFSVHSPKVLKHLATSFLSGVFNAEDHEPVKKDLTRLGLSSNLIHQVIQENLEVDPEPVATLFLGRLKRINMVLLLEAAQISHQALYELEQRMSHVNDWPIKTKRIKTALGSIYIGTEKGDIHDEKALLIIDPSGDDLYTENAAHANGIQNFPAAVVLDLDGDDRYIGNKVLGPGTGFFGISIILDRQGNDFYRSEYTGQGAGLFGVGWLEDCEGDDVYKAHALAQACGYMGLGILQDKAGEDLYDASYYAQGMSGVKGVGILVDKDGNDRYMAGGRLPDYERYENRFLSLAQGFSIGMRPFAGGGIAALVDLEGSDTYECDVYGQGVSYWYSVGMLLDHSGNDTYHAHQYGQGSGIHLSVGLLADSAGNDYYTGYSLLQGNAHDYGVGMLLDREGNDTYTCFQGSQAFAINNALALLIDSKGKDAYFGYHSEQSQGVGNDGGQREYGALALLLDLDGHDQYSSAAKDGERIFKPNFGILYDYER
ncbi:MAG: hypothetical protein GKR87_03780 [Kiritimatiellae bacterium]|nr:hypothetical protein [Kiritimatiellia bacterium]